MIWKLLALVLMGYVALCVVIFLFQRKLLYFPYGPQLTEARATVAGLRHWPSLDDFRGFVAQEEPPDAKGTVIVFHGNAGTAYQRSYYIDALKRQNMRVVLAEYPGYGGRDGKPSEDVLVADATETIRLAYEEFGGPMYVWGESLGSGVVSSAVSKTKIPIKGMVLLLTWDSLPNVAQSHYWYFPARWLVLDRYNNIENLKGYQGKIAVLLAKNDEIIPVQLGRNLYNSISTEKKLWVFENVFHNEIPIGAELHWWKEVIEFISEEDTSGNY